jgi:hypothetical protein
MTRTWPGMLWPISRGGFMVSITDRSKSNQRER